MNIIWNKGYAKNDKRKSINKKKENYLWIKDINSLDFYIAILVNIKLFSTTVKRLKIYFILSKVMELKI